MDRKKIVKIILIALIILGIIYVVFDYMAERESFKGFFSNIYYTITGYDPYGDPCYTEPGLPDPCGGS